MASFTALQAVEGARGTPVSRVRLVHSGDVFCVHRPQSQWCSSPVEGVKAGVLLFPFIDQITGNMQNTVLCLARKAEKFTVWFLIF